MRPKIRFDAIERVELCRRHSFTDSSVSPLTLLHAPAGYGKTVTALMWLELSGIPREDVYWVQARSDWDGPEELWRAIRAELVAGGDPDPRLATGECRSEVEQALSKLSRTSVLVIDDYQYVTDPVLDLRIAALTELNANVFVGVLSRRFAALDGPSVAGRVTTTTIGAADLAFSRDEVERLAHLSGVDDPATIDLIFDSTRGWPFSVQRALSESSGNRAERQLAFVRFADESLQAIRDPLARQALLATALCEGITDETVGEFIGLSAPEATEQMRALEELGEERATELRRRHAFGIRDDDPGTAFRELLELREFRSAEQVMLANFIELTERGANTLSILRAYPIDDIEDYFGLLAARCYMELFDPSAPAYMLKPWIVLLRDTTCDHLASGTPEHRVAALGILMAAERLLGNGPESHRLARELEKQLTDTSERNLSGAFRTRPLLYHVLGFTAYMNGDYEMALRNCELALGISESEHIDEFRLATLSSLALSSATMGEFRLAEGYLERRLSAGRTTSMPDPDAFDINLMLTQAMLAMNRTEAEPGRERLRLVESIMNRQDHWAAYVCVESALVRIGYGTNEGLLTLQRRCETVESGIELVPYQKTMLTAHAATLRMLTGDFSGAEQLLDGLPEDHACAAVARARLSLLTAAYADAVEIADRARRAEITPRKEIEANLIGAVAHWDLGHRADAFSALRRGVEQMRSTGGGDWYLGTVPYRSLAELARAARDADEVDIVDDVEALPETLRVQQFEPLTPAELRTLQGLHGGGSLREVADSLFLTQNTVKTHLRGIYRKLRVSGRTEAVRFGLQAGLIEVRD